MEIRDVQSSARYGGYLGVQLPRGHWAWSPGLEGDNQSDPRIVMTRPVVREQFTNMADAIGAAQRVSAGARDAVAVTREPGQGDDGPWRVEQLLVKPIRGETGYRGIDLEGVVDPLRGMYHVWQPLHSQRQVIVGAIVDGPLLLDDVKHYVAADPGSDPDRPRT